MEKKLREEKKAESQRMLEQQDNIRTDLKNQMRDNEESLRKQKITQDQGVPYLDVGEDRRAMRKPGKRAIHT